MQPWDLSMQSEVQHRWDKPWVLQDGCFTWLSSRADVVMSWIDIFFFSTDSEDLFLGFCPILAYSTNFRPSSYLYSSGWAEMGFYSIPVRECN